MRKHALRRVARHQMFRLLAVVERLSPREYELAFSPTFVVGPPRSGSTLVRQLIAWGLPTCHFTNLLAESKLALGRPLPAACARAVRWRHGSPPLDRHWRRDPFHNTYGHMPGASAPAEGELIWAHWFGTRYGPVQPEDLPAEKVRGMHRAVAATERIVGLPFVNKTSTLSLRIRALARVFPGALFVHVRRDPVDTAQSIYRARRTEYPDWLGARPAECAGAEKWDLCRQVADQVHYIERAIARDRRVVGEGRFLSVRYRDVCVSPARELARIAEFMTARGAPVRRIRELPGSFPFSHGRRIEESAHTAIRARLAELATARRAPAAGTDDR